MIHLFGILKSKYCKLVFTLTLILSYFLIPNKVFHGIHNLIAILFMVVFSLTMTCITYNIKERVKLARTYKNSVLSIIATAVGLSALQVCGVGAPVCTATLGAGILASIFPITFVKLISDYSILIISISILFQLTALYLMNCFKKVPSSRN
ncbi:hypothetical protein HOA59_03325 [archaeon]|jgi:hypothetical protein|nr:hypothetical protein [archaeon]MBT6824439.1 hypothetical protein [archaeon]MBT7107283.1 hypothetical protein [archaeon]MBT7297414.1 hypothetical protein [archaeon]